MYIICFFFAKVCFQREKKKELAFYREAAFEDPVRNNREEHALGKNVFCTQVTWTWWSALNV